MIVLGVHGIDTARDYPLGRIWSRRLRRTVEPVRWDSRGAAEDVWRMATDFAWRWAQINRVMYAIRSAQERALRQSAPLAVVGHSAGAVFAHAAMRHMRRLGWRMTSIYPVYLGSPITHPLIGRWCERVGLGSHLALHEDTMPTIFVNRDDPIASMRMLGYRRPWWADVREIDVIDYGAHLEHLPDPYLLHPMVHEHLHAIDTVEGPRALPVDIKLE